jgi:hypothetical protein
LLGNGGVVQLMGSGVENPHGLHLKTSKSSPKARLIVCSKSSVAHAQDK